MRKLENLNFEKKLKFKLWQDSKTQIVIKLKNKKYDKTRKKIKLWKNTKTQIVPKLKNSNCDNSKTQIVRKLKNLNGDKTQKFKLWQNSKILNGDKTLKHKLWPKKLKTRRRKKCLIDSQFYIINKCFRERKTSICDKTQKLKVWQN